jgi:hypothetical protein
MKMSSRHRRRVLTKKFKVYCNEERYHLNDHHIVAENKLSVPNFEMSSRLSRVEMMTNRQQGWYWPQEAGRCCANGHTLFPCLMSVRMQRLRLGNAAGRRLMDAGG